MGYKSHKMAELRKLNPRTAIEVLRHVIEVTQSWRLGISGVSAISLKCKTLMNHIFAFGLSAKLMPKALELLFPHPTHPFC
jgi:hypothetical protein